MIYVFLSDGFEEIEALTPLDVLRRAGVEVTTVGIGGTSILGAHGIRVEADIPDVMYTDSAPEAVILPGGMPGAKNLDESRTVDGAVRAAARRGALLAAICAAPSFAHASVGSGATSKNVVCCMPISSSLSVMGLVYPLLYKKLSVTINAFFLPMTCLSSSRATGRQPFFI